MEKVIEVKFRDSGKIYFFDPLDFDVKKGDGVIAETARGLVYGEVASEPHCLSEEQIVAPLKPIMRIATDEDKEQRQYYLDKEREAFRICQRRIEESGLSMKLVDAEYAFNGSKLTFYFTADSRVDFRELVKELACEFKTRIDLRQIGVRDEAKKCGGLGCCGRPVCCNSFLTEFMPVSIKMAKAQNLSLNPTKISGICGRLMCCLKYEQECYETMQKQMPHVGSACVTADGDGVVLENNVITEMTKVKVTLSDGTLDVRSYPFREIVLKGSEKAPAEGADYDEEDADFDGDNTFPADDGNEDGEAYGAARKSANGDVAINVKEDAEADASEVENRVENRAENGAGFNRSGRGERRGGKRGMNAPNSDRANKFVREDNAASAPKAAFAPRASTESKANSAPKANFASKAKSTQRESTEYEAGSGNGGHGRRNAKIIQAKRFNEQKAQKHKKDLRDISGETSDEQD